MNDPHDIATATGYFIGLDLGERVDYTALSVLREHRVLTGKTVARPVEFDLTSGTIYEDRPETETQYDMIYLDRWRHRGYRAAVPIVAELLARLRHTSDPPATVLVDHTGVGIAVLEDLRAAGLQCVGITFTGGSVTNRRGRDYLVPKREIVSNLKVLVENRRLDLPPDLPLSDILEGEMENLKRNTKLTTGNDTYGAGEEWREGAHDDLVFSVAMAAWFAMKGKTSTRRRPLGMDALIIQPVQGWDSPARLTPPHEKERYFRDPTKRNDDA